MTIAAKGGGCRELEEATQVVQGSFRAAGNDVEWTAGWRRQVWRRRGKKRLKVGKSGKVR